MLNFIITLLLICSVNTVFANSEPIEEYSNQLQELMTDLQERDVPQEWFLSNLERDNFTFYPRVEHFFNNMAENRVRRGEISVLDYKNFFGIEEKIRKGLIFIEEHYDILSEVQKINGIDFELVVSILGMETNFAQERQRGNFYVFDTLVSQYILLSNRRRFAVNELSALYRFSEKIDKDIDYFIGSFAGASGWGQFIPTSLEYYFKSIDGVDKNTDIFSIEDTLVSIDNYLALHRLNKNTMDSHEHRYNAVYAYNHSDAYVQAVLYMYKQLKKR